MYWGDEKDKYFNICLECSKITELAEGWDECNNLEERFFKAKEAAGLYDVKQDQEDCY
jgi:hypothetical protein